MRENRVYLNTLLLLQRGARIINEMRSRYMHIYTHTRIYARVRVEFLSDVHIQTYMLVNVERSALFIAQPVRVEHVLYTRT